MNPRTEDHSTLENTRDMRRSGRSKLSLLLLAAIAPAAFAQLQRVAYDDAGNPVRQPHRVEGQDYAYPLTAIPADVAPEGDPLRTVSFGNRVRFGYAGVRPGVVYTLRMTLLSDGPRSVQVGVDSRIVQENLDLEPGKVVRVEYTLPPVPPRVTEMLVEIRRLTGPNAVISEIEILSFDPHELSPIPDAETLNVRRLAAAVAALPEPPRLTPRPDVVTGVTVPQMSLGGTWYFSAAAPDDVWTSQHIATDDWASIRVPGEWAMQGFTVPPGETACYVRHFEPPVDWRGKRVKLRFDCVHSFCRAWVNGQEVGSHEGGFVPFEFDVTQAIRPGINQLCVGVRSGTVSDTLSSISQYAAHPVGGILRKVTLFALPELHVSEMVVTTHLSDPGSAELRVETKLSEAIGSAEVRLRVDVTPPGGVPQSTLLDETQLAEGSLRAKVELAIPNPILWDPEHPRLYQLHVALVRDNAVLHTLSRRVGIREVAVMGNRLLVNGRPIKLLGVNRHEVHPLLGRSLTPELCRLDAEIFRDANCNYIRTSHYPPSEEFLDACDELGLLVESEAALCWIEHGANPIWKRWDYEDSRFLPHLVRANEENVMAGRDHPSVILWSLGNESRWSPLWEHVLERVRRLDPSRPTSFHDQCWGDYNNGGSKAIIANYHYPDERGPTRCDAEARPVLFGEFAHLQCYNRRELVTDPGVRDDWGRPLERMIDLMRDHPGCAGGAIWSGIDDTFHLPDGRIVGYGPWGPLDGWRRMKPEYWHLKKAYSPIHVVDRLRPVRVADGRIRVEVENQYFFTDLREVETAWRIGAQRGAATLQAAPQARGVIEIRPVQPIRAGDRLELTFTDPRGFACETESLVIESTDPQADPIAVPRNTVTLEETERSYLITSGDMNCTVDRLTGRIERLAAGDTQIALGGPTLMVLPLSQDTGGDGGVAGNDYQNRIAPFTPTCDVWEPRATRARTEDECVEVVIEGRYQQAEGAFTLRFNTDASLDVSYRFVPRADVDPRQWGVVLDLPADLDILRWNRRTQWSSYPSDHIGRAAGEARAAPQPRTSVEEHGIEPSLAWSQDTMDLGSNDFRSTKFDIREASVVGRDSRGLRILATAETPTSIRAWIDQERVRVLIAGFHTGGADGFFAAHFTAERRPLKKGGSVIEGRFRLSPAH